MATRREGRKRLGGLERARRDCCGREASLGVDGALKRALETMRPCLPPVVSSTSSSFSRRAYLWRAAGRVQGPRHTTRALMDGRERARRAPGARDGEPRELGRTAVRARHAVATQAGNEGEVEAELVDEPVDGGARLVGEDLSREISKVSVSGAAGSKSRRRGSCTQPERRVAAEAEVGAAAAARSAASAVPRKQLSLQRPQAEASRGALARLCFVTPMLNCRGVPNTCRLAPWREAECGQGRRWLQCLERSSVCQPRKSPECP